MQDNIFTAEVARPRIMKGIKRCSDAVGITMGTSGRNSILEDNRQPGFDLTNDGITILESIRFEDRLEDMGQRFLLEAVKKANKSSGDGSSTTCVLTAAILEEGIKHLEEESPMDIKRSLEACIPIIEESIKKQSKAITMDEIHTVASISAEDEGIGMMIEEIYKKIGKDGIINWEASKTPEDSYEISSGIKIEDAGFISPYLNDIDASTGWVRPEAKAKDVSVILCAQKLSNLDALNSIFALLNDKGDDDVVLFADEVTPEVVGQLVATRAKRGFRVILVRMPTIWKSEWWEDLSLASGATVISSNFGVPLNSIEEKHLGKFGNIIVRKDEVLVDGIKDLKKHILTLQVNNDEDSLRRVARLNIKTARYFVGGHSESSLSYRRRKVEDAINAASEALDGGVVVGGGVALLNASYAIDNEILQEALKAPARQIMTNAGAKKDIIQETNEHFGFNSKTGKVEDLVEAGVVDPAKVVLSAVKAAIGVASGILTLGTVVLLSKEEPPQGQPSLIQR